MFLLNPFLVLFLGEGSVFSMCTFVYGDLVQQLESDHRLEGPYAWVQGLERLDFVKPNASKWGGTMGHRGPCLSAASK